MRPVEILLVVADLLTFLVVAVPRLHAASFMRGIALLTFSLAVVQILVESPRWQMAPAYVLAGLFLFVWVVQSFVKSKGIVKRIRTRRLVVGCAISLAIIGLLLSAALPIVLPVFSFPHPSGPYAIGTVTYHWPVISFCPKRYQVPDN